MAKVHVIMGNDFPDAVFATKRKASAYVARKKKETEHLKEVGIAKHRIYWRSYEFELR